MRNTRRPLGSRRQFLGQVGLAAGALVAARASAQQPAVAASGTSPSPPPASGTRYPPTRDDGGAAPSPSALPDWFPRQDPALVEKMVGVAHGNLAEVTALLERRPELAKAQWDWGYGDWESAIDAASHTGQREIALLLLRHGARPTIFSAAMLGQLDVVKAFVAAAPGVQGTPGPHGIPLLAHAQVGGAPAAAVLSYLEALGGADGGTARPALSEEAARLYVGLYRTGTIEADSFEVGSGRRGLTLARHAGTLRGLVPVGEHAFHPVGAPSVRVRFEVAGDKAVALVLDDAERPLRAVRAVG